MRQAISNAEELARKHGGVNVLTDGLKNDTKDENGDLYHLREEEFIKSRLAKE